MRRSRRSNGVSGPDFEPLFRDTQLQFQETLNEKSGLFLQMQLSTTVVVLLGLALVSFERVYDLEKRIQELSK